MKNKNLKEWQVRTNMSLERDVGFMVGQKDLSCTKTKSG